ncbi:hypothetical protein [Filimonas lacunae]|nr:hypothetical protein [Filimonas lacunae]
MKQILIYMGALALCLAMFWWKSPQKSIYTQPDAPDTSFAQSGSKAINEDLAEQKTDSVPIIE